MTHDPRRILIVADKFKGTLSSREAVAAIALGWSQVRPQDHIQLLPMADGGEGFGEVIGELVGAQPRTCVTVDAAGRIRNVQWWLAATASVAVLEASQVNGLELLRSSGRHPREFDTFGLGAVLQAIWTHGVGRIYVGLGGSGTNDGGFGIARALGFRFIGRAGRVLGSWTELAELVALEAPESGVHLGQLTIAVDVNNPLLGRRGATYVYGPQKGLLDSQLSRAEQCLERLACVVKDTFGKDFAKEPGAGAAGGLGFGLRAFANGEFRSGAELFAELSHLRERIERAEIVITGEGTLDAQSLSGKGVGAVIEMAAACGKPCVCLAGSVADGFTTLAPGFRSYAIVSELATLAYAMLHPGECVQRLAARAAADA
jgi:glycerate kinase